MWIPKIIDEIRTIFWCWKLNLHRYEINKNGEVNVGGNVFISPRLGLKKLPIKFNTVNGNFVCAYGELESFYGFPNHITGSLNVENNKIKSFKGIPKVNGSIILGNNQIKSFEDLPDNRI